MGGEFEGERGRGLIGLEPPPNTVGGREKVYTLYLVCHISSPALALHAQNARSPPVETVPFMVGLPLDLGRIWATAPGGAVESRVDDLQSVRLEVVKVR